MFDDDFAFQKDLVSHHVYTSWQFIQYTQKNINVAVYCLDTIERIIATLTDKTIRWQQDIFSDFVEEIDADGKKMSRITVTTDNSPVYELRVAGEKIDPWFLFNKLLRDFYQYVMNSFDSISQVANSGLLANRGKRADVVDFQRMYSCFTQQTYTTAFPKTSAWFTSVANSPEFQYIEAINNRAKHTADIANKLAMGILGSSNTAQIGPFFRKDVQHDKKDLSAQMHATLDFLEQSWDGFLTVFCEEYVLDTFVNNRRHTIGGVYQQRISNDVSQNMSYAYIQETAALSLLPDEQYILFVNVNEEIDAHECPFETLLICSENDKTNVIGRYIAEESIGNDCLLHYRKYVKDSVYTGKSCIFEEFKGEETRFYHSNPFFNVTDILDDNTLCHFS